MSEDKQSKAADFVKKILTAGIGTVFLTEESLRGLFSELKLPKELLGGLLESANKTKQDFIKSFSDEVLSRLSERVNFVDVAQEFLQKNEIQFSVSVKVNPRVEKAE